MQVKFFYSMKGLSLFDTVLEQVIQKHPNMEAEQQHDLAHKIAREIQSHTYNCVTFVYDSDKDKLDVAETEKLGE